MTLGELPAQLTVPDAFMLDHSRGGFTTHNGPVFAARAADDVRSGFFVLERHCNRLGFLHGGMASAFADRSLARAVWHHTQRLSVTLKLTLHYYETVPLHSWLEAHPELLSLDNDVVQVRAELKIAGQKLAARADATFRLLRRTQKQA